MIIAQISDTHITLPGTRVDTVCRTTSHLEQTVAHLNSLPALPDIVIITGDCTDKGKPEEYQRLKEILSPLKMPVYLIPGNHDDRNQFRQAIGSQGEQEMEGFVQYVIDRGP